MRRLVYLPILAVVAVFLIGCPKGNRDFDAGKKAEQLQDYDTALVDYQRALRSDPSNAEYKLREIQIRFDDSQYHLEQGRNDVNKGDLQMALAEFQRAETVDPSNSAASDEVKKTLELIAARNGATAPTSATEGTPSVDSELLATPPELKPLSREPINFRATEDARTVFETIGKLAGLSVLFDPDFVSRRISVELPGVTLEQALDAVSLESKAFWKPLTSTVIFIAPDNPQKRRDLDDEEVRTFYLANSLTPQDLTEVVTGLRQLLDLRRVTQVNADNAIVVRDTPDKLILAAKIIHDIDQARPEVLIHFQVLSASLDRLRDLGVLPGQSATIQFTPLTTNQPNGGSSSSSSSSSTSNQITLNNLKNISLSDYSATLPGATANAILTDNKTHIIQDPEIRITDGEKASLKIGSRVPVATGSFQAGVGVGVGGGAGVVNPLVNTQFQYIDVGVNIDVTPRVHPDGDVSLTLSLDVSSVTGESSIGGIQQPVIGQNKIGPDQIRLKPGEVSVLGGLFQTTNTNSVNGIPGLAKLPFFKYLFSDNRTESQTSDILVVITPHVLRMPSITTADLRPLAAGTDTNVRVYYKDEEPQDGASPSALGQSSATPPATAAPSPAAAPNAPAAAQLQFTPSSATIKPGARVTLGLNVANVKDLYSIPLLIHYDPAVIQVEDVTNGGFLSGGTQEVAVVQRVDAQHGDVIVSATRQPNTPGVNGSGALLGLVVRGVAPGTSAIQILQVNARNSQQQTIPMVSGEATIHVQ